MAEINEYIGTPGSAVRIRGRLYVDSLFILPFSETTETENPVIEGAIKYIGEKKTPYYFDGTNWMPVGNNFKETVVLINGVINDINIPTSFARFAGQNSVILTGIDAAGIIGKNIIIRNETGTILTIKHLSDSSSDANRIYINGEVDLPIVDKGSATFYYSKILAMWVLSETFGNSYSPQYIGKTGQVITTVGDGTTTKEDVVEIEIVRNDLTEDQSSDDLNILFPDAVLLFKVYVPNKTSGGGYYVLIDDINKTWQFIGTASGKIFTLVTNTGNQNFGQEIEVGKLIETVVVTPTGDLSAFSIGTTEGASDIVSATSVDANKASVFPIDEYLTETKTIWFNGVTAVSSIKIYTK